MVTRPRISALSQQVENNILCFLHFRCANSEITSVTEEDLYESITGHKSGIVHYAIEELVENGFIEKEVVTEFDKEFLVFHITRQGILWVDNWSDKEYEEASAGIDFLEEHQEEDAHSYNIPASDRMVTLDHNSDSYTQAVESLDKAIQAFREDHHLDNELGKEKPALIKALEGGRELLNDSTINLRIGTLLLVEPLKHIAAKYDHVLVGSLAATAMTAIARLFGLL